jgi:hypothetical protein
VEGALSELVITSDHSAQEKHDAIVEMRRILSLQFNEYALERQALAKGAKSVVRVTRPPGRTPVFYSLAQPAVQPQEDRLARSERGTEPPASR